MKKTRKVIAMFMLSVLMLFLTSSVFALDTYYGQYHLSGSGHLYCCSIDGTFTVQNTSGISDVLSCSISGFAYNGANSVVGMYSGSNTAHNKSSVTASGAGECYVLPSYMVTYYTFNGVTWVE